jgi:hypothetical protein
MRYLFGLSCLLFAMSCQGPTGEKHGDWVSDGLKIADIDSMLIGHNMTASDTLKIRYVLGHIPGFHKPEFSHFQIVRDSFGVAISVWAEAFHWEGAIDMPPSDDYLHIDSTVVLAPPFYSPRCIVTTSQNDKPARMDTVAITNTGTHTVIGTWWMTGFSKIFSNSQIDTVFSNLSIRNILALRSDSLFTYYQYTDTSWQRNRFSYVMKSDTLSLNEEPYEKNWIVSFGHDTLLLELVNVNSTYRFVEKFLPYTGAIPPDYWGQFDPNSEHP